MPEGIRWVGLDVHARESTVAIFDQDRVKTDKRDAIRLARLLAAGGLVLVTIPSVEREKLRDLVRCREDIRADLMRARHRIGKLLLRREVYYDGPAVAWSRKRRSWLTSVRFADQASRATMADLPTRSRCAGRSPRSGRGRALKARAQRAVRAHGGAGCGACVGSTRSRRWGCAQRSARGSALIIPTSLPPILGIVASEHTSGAVRRLGAITKAGSTHARRLLVEAAYHYRRGPAVGEHLERRQRGHAPEVIHISWKAQRRLNARWRQLKDARKKANGIVAVAIARELAGYCWEIATWAPHPDPVPPASLPAGDPLTQPASNPRSRKKTPTPRRRLTNSR